MRTVMRTVTMQTFIMTDSVLYIVIDGDGDAGDFGDAKEVWRREVPFTHRERFNAVGPAFVEAAREQARIAEELAIKNEGLT